MAQNLVTPRPWYAKVPFLSTSAPPPKITPDDTQLLLTPEATANWAGLITFGWLGDLLSLGYARPLETSDLYRLPSSRDSAKYAARIEKAFQRRKTHADRINAKIDNRELKPPLHLRLIWALTGNSKTQYGVWIKNHPRAEPSFVLTLNDVVFQWLWVGGALKILADIGTVCTPLLIRVSTVILRSYLGIITNPLQRLSRTMLPSRIVDVVSLMRPRSDRVSDLFSGCS